MSDIDLTLERSGARTGETLAPDSGGVVALDRELQAATSGGTTEAAAARGATEDLGTAATQQTARPGPAPISATGGGPPALAPMGAEPSIPPTGGGPPALAPMESHILARAGQAGAMEMDGGAAAPGVTDRQGSRSGGAQPAGSAPSPGGRAYVVMPVAVPVGVARSLSSAGPERMPDRAFAAPRGHGAEASPAAARAQAPPVARRATRPLLPAGGAASAAVRMADRVMGLAPFGTSTAAVVAGEPSGPQVAASAEPGARGLRVEWRPPLPKDDAERYAVLDARAGGIEARLRRSAAERSAQLGRASDLRAKLQAARERAATAAALGEPRRRTAEQEGARWLEEATLARSAAADLEHRIRVDEGLLTETRAARDLAVSAMLGSHRAAEQWAGAAEHAERRARAHEASAVVGPDYGRR